MAWTRGGARWRTRELAPEWRETAILVRLGEVKGRMWFQILYWWPWVMLRCGEKGEALVGPHPAVALSSVSPFS